MDEAEQSQEKSPEQGKPVRKREKAGGILLIILIIGSLLGFRWVVKSHTDISTDNAFVEAHIYTVSSRIPGTVTRVHVEENQRINEGEVLVELDPEDYRIKVDNATAEVAMARNETSGDYAKVEGARAALSLANARLSQAQVDLERGKVLFSREIIPKEQLDRLETAGKVAASQVREAEENVRKDQAMVGSFRGASARIRQKEAKLKEARFNLSHVQVKAPSNGYATRKSVEVGNNIQAGQSLLAVVDLSDTWVTANYKESQLRYVRPGQPVTLHVDMYPGIEFHGRVESIMAGTGAAFSLLPPENATGNYVKVVQRIPVRIRLLPDADPDHLLRVGMSVVPVIATGRTPGDVLRDMTPF